MDAREGLTARSTLALRDNANQNVTPSSTPGQGGLGRQFVSLVHSATVDSSSTLSSNFAEQLQISLSLYLRATSDSQ